MKPFFGKFIEETDKFIEEYCEILSIDNYQQTAKVVARMVGLINTKPHSLASATIYLSCLFNGEKLDFEELRTASGVCKTRLNQLLDRICPHWREFE